MPNMLVGTTSASPPSRIGVGVDSIVIVPENTERSGLVVTNISSQTVYLAFGHTATLQAGVVLSANGGAFSFDDFSYSKDAVSAIGHSSTLLIAYQEFIRV